jgi:hypothetical protein
MPEVGERAAPVRSSRAGGGGDTGGRGEGGTGGEQPHRRRGDAQVDG